MTENNDGDGRNWQKQGPVRLIVHKYEPKDEAKSYSLGIEIFHRENFCVAPISFDRNNGSWMDETVGCLGEDLAKQVLDSFPVGFYEIIGELWSWGEQYCTMDGYDYDEDHELRDALVVPVSEEFTDRFLPLDEVNEKYDVEHVYFRSGEHIYPSGSPYDHTWGEKGTLRLTLHDGTEVEYLGAARCQERDEADLYIEFEDKGQEGWCRPSDGYFTFESKNILNKKEEAVHGS